VAEPRWLERRGDAAEGERRKRPNWWDTRKGILDKGIELGIPAPAGRGPEHVGPVHGRGVGGKAGDGPWWDDTSVAYPIAVKLRDGDGIDLAQLATAALRKEGEHA
jgi:hypothetical protein